MIRVKTDSVGLRRGDLDMARDFGTCDKTGRCREITYIEFNLSYTIFWNLLFPLLLS